ncbi:hypothetical protein TNCV_2583971 [Trichonephila clavipes]|nr:hypothetical protein TNCV_2583971 [Trichonephila clavipes]
MGEINYPVNIKLHCTINRSDKICESSEEAVQNYSIAAQSDTEMRSMRSLIFLSVKTSDEAHFWLNGYVNKQNCRIWSEANPQVYVETPLHPEKLTVWCALWAGGILLQKR